MTKVETLKEYSDERGNRVRYAGTHGGKVSVTFNGSNNALIVDASAKIGQLGITFSGDGSTISIGGNTGKPAMQAFMQIGHESSIVIGTDVTMTGPCFISAVEGATVWIGDDVMIGMNVEVRSDDAHAIYDVQTGERINLAADVKIGNHVWLAKKAAVMGGVEIGEGSVVGFGSVVTADMPNNCIAAGSPARVVRTNVAWERPHLALEKPSSNPGIGSGQKSDYWNLSDYEMPAGRRAKR